jgi:cyanophycin synthetase
MGELNTMKLIELRVLDGPNLYFTRPAIKLTMGIGAWLALPEDRAGHLAERAAGADLAKPGPPRSERRRRFVARLAVQLTRSLADITKTKLAVRGRAGAEADQIVVAFPWRRRQTSEAFAKEIPGLLTAALDARHSVARAMADAGHRVARVEPGPSPATLEPKIPVVAVTGTNGKTTTVRLIAHIARVAGHTVGSTTTDGVYRDGELVEAGDYSGFGGAAMALAQPGVDFAVLETARGGILLRGIGTTHNDVAVVTNVTEDHLDQYGIRTLDQLAEVKATITRITKPQGWDVLNADDPRVFAMRRMASGRPWLFALDPDHPALRTTLAEGGRAITILDGSLVTMSADRPMHLLVPVLDVPVTLAGISSYNIRNAMAATAAALGAGVPENAVVEGLASFTPDPERNPGRANLFELAGRVVIIDYAHNEDGMRGLVEICRGLRSGGEQIWIAFGSAGDRPNTHLHRLGYTAARGADRVAIAELHRYLRGRHADDLVRRLHAGVADGGQPDAPVFPTELDALEWMLRESHPGDVVAVTGLAQRSELFAYMREHGAAVMTPAEVKARVQPTRAPR